MLVLIFTRKLRPITIGSSSGWLMFAGYDRPAARDLVADELRRDHPGDRSPEAHARVLAPEGIPRAGRRQLHEVCGLLQLRVLADRDELHLGRHDPPPRVGELRDALPLLGLQDPLRAPVEELDRVAAALALGLLAVLLREVAVVDGPHLAARDLLHVAPLADPRRAQGREPECGVAMEGGVAPRARGVVHADRVVRHLGAVRQPGGGERDLAHRDPEVGPRALEVHLARRGEEPVPWGCGFVGLGHGWDCLRPRRMPPVGSQIPPLAADGPVFPTAL